MDTPKLYYDPPLPFFTLWFILVYIVGYFIVFKNWNRKHRPEASSFLMSLAHGTPALVLSILSILQPQSSISQLDFTSPNTSFQNLVLEYSIAYFLMDLLHYMVLVRGDALFIAYHIATLYVLMTCRYAFGHGAVGILGILVLAEGTTTCQNTRSLARWDWFLLVVDNCMIPRWAWVSWIAVIVAGIGVSLLWVVHLWIDLYRQSSEDVKKSS